MRREPRPIARRVGASTVLASLLVLGAVVQAQQVELSRADRLAILYTPQLQFAPGGEPLIKIGIAEGERRIRFSADTRISILPLGDGGSEISVPADTTYEVEIESSQPGRYAYSVVVAELTPSERSAVDGIRQSWEARGYSVRTRQVGSIFAVSGQRFDTRKTLLTVEDTDSYDAALALSEQIALAYGTDSRVHAELDEYPGGTLTLSGISGGVTVTNRDLLWIRGGDDTVFTVRDVAFDRGTRFEGTETREYVGSLIFTTDRNGDLALVNETTLERLVRGVLPSEVYSHAPVEALRAQAVAARSELLADLGVRHLADPYMTCADQRCQVYGGVEAEHRSTTVAADATRGEILADGDQVIKAYYSSNNGGFSASNASTWGEEERPYLRAHPDGRDPPDWMADGLGDEDEVRAFLAQDPAEYHSSISSFGSGRNFRWSEEMSGSDLSLAVARRYEVGPVTALEILERDTSGRVSRLRIEGTRSEVVVERELNVRRALGGLRSALFVLEADRAADGIIEEVRLEGAGFGHGVGLCQTGSIGMAERGHDYRAILENYYPGTELRTLY